MTDPLIPQTKLDAVNLMLASIGQTPLNTLDTAGIRDAAIAELQLDMITRSVLTKGWSFNTDWAFEIVPDVNNNHLVPSNSLNIVPCDLYRNYVERDNGGTRMMYDRDENSYVITDTVKYDIVRAFAFDTLPEVARGYIGTRAGRIFQANTIGSKILFEYTELHERESLAALQRIERRTKRLNIFSAASDINQIVQREHIPSR